MKSGRLIALCMLLAIPSFAIAQDRNWHTGTLLETEQQKVLEGTTRTRSSNGNSDRNGYSQNSTTTKTDNYDTYQIFTISSGPKLYIARQKLNFPWSKPSLTGVGEPVKFAVEKGSLYVLGDDGKQHKMGIVRVSMKEVATQ